MMEALLAIIVIVAFVAAVGHLIWIGVAALIRWLAGLSSDPRDRPLAVELCPRCGEVVVRGLDGKACILCGWSAAGLSGRVRTDTGRVLEQLCRRVSRYEEVGLIPPGLGDRLIKAIRAEAPPKTAHSVAMPVAPAPEPVEITAWEAEPEPIPTPRSEHPAPTEPETARDVREGVAARAREFAASMARRQEVTPAEAMRPAPPKPPAQPLSKLLSAFLEEKNIRWGEVVGGMLIVGCSLALVISFWASIAERPWLKFGLFNGVTAAIFAIGFHAERHWRLPTTARGLLVIAGLLTPLNMLAVASFSRASAESPAVWVGEAVAVALFAVLCLGAGRYLAGKAAWALPVAVVVPSAAMFLIRRLAGPESATGALLAIGAVPLAAQAAAMGGLLHAVRRGSEADEPSALDLLRALGLGAFAALLALGLLVARSGPAVDVVRRLSPLLPLAAAPGLATGLWLWRRATATDLAAYRTAGTSIAAGALLVSLAAVAVPWPDPAGMTLGAGLNAAILLAIAVVLEIPAAHAAAGACLSLTYLLGWLMLTGRLAGTASSAEALAAILSRSSGLILMPLALAALGVVATASRRGRAIEAQAYALVAALVAAVSVGLVAWHGFGLEGDPAGAAWVFAAYAAAAMGCAAWFACWPLFEASGGIAEVRAMTGLGSGLAFAAIVQGLVFGLRTRWGLTAPWLDALLAHATSSLIAVSMMERLAAAEPAEAHPVAGRSRLPRRLCTAAESAREILVMPLIPAAVLASLGWLWLLAGTPMSSMAGHAAWLAIVWLGLGWRKESPAMFAAFQASLAAAVACGTGVFLEGREWFRGGPSWLDPRSLQALGIALAALGLGWIAVRRWADRGQDGDRLRRLLNPSWPPFDRIALGVPAAMIACLAIYAAAPGVAQELSPRSAAGRVAPPAALFEIPGILHSPAMGAGSWLLLGLVLATILAGCRAQIRRADMAAAVAVGWLAVPLLAGLWEADVAVASALRWWSALYGLAASAKIWGRDGLVRLAGRLGLPIAVEPGAGPAGAWLVIGLSLAAPLLIFGYVTTAMMAGNLVLGPEPGTLLAGLGSLRSYLPPVVLLALAMIGCAVREHSGRFAFASALALEAAATLGCLMVGTERGVGFEDGLWVYLAQVDAAVAAGFAIPWLGVLGGWSRRSESARPAAIPGSPVVLVGLGAALNIVVLAAGAVLLWLDPVPRPDVQAMAGPLGWISFGLAVTAVGLHARVAGRALGSGGLGMGLVAGAAMLAIGRAAWDIGDWRAYHEMIASQSIAGLLLLLAGRIRAGRSEEVPPPSARWPVAAWATLSMGIVALYAVRGYDATSPQYPWWTLGGLAAAIILAIGLSAWTTRAGYLWLAAVLINLAMTLAWCASPWWTAWPPSEWQPVDFVIVNVLGLALPVSLWIWLGRAIRRERWAMLGLPTAAATRPIALPRVASWIALIGLGLVVPAALSMGTGADTSLHVALGWLAVAATAAAFVAGFWDHSVANSLRGLYLLGLGAAGWALVPLRLSGEMLVWLGSIVLAAYGILTSYLWSRRGVLRGLASRLGIDVPAPVDEDEPGLLIAANMGIVVAVISLSFGTILTNPDVVRRSCAADAVLASTLAVGLLARGRRRSILQAAALGVGVVGAIAWGWAWLDPASSTEILDRVVVSFAALVAGAILYGLGLAKFLPRFEQWTRAARRLVPGLLALALAAIVVVLGAEAAAAANGEAAAISAWAAIVVATTFAVAAAAAIVAAVVPGRDPLGLSERGRTAYVYGAEALLAVLVLHLKLSMPWLFGGFLARYMSLILLGVAFLGVGLSELFRRQGRRVLAEPLERTGVFLPFVPLAKGLWSAPDPAQAIVFFVLAGALYATLSALRSSMVFAAMAALAFNGAVWTLLGQVEGLGLLHHPQLWIIPPALCAVVGAYWNRDRLSEAQLAAVRYASAVAIYVSSLGDIALTGVAQAPWLPGVLALLGIAGIFAGIVLRVRGFLYLGLGAVCLAVFTITWYAAVDLQQSWLWWACGIAAGILILILFGLFEKKREDILKVVDELKAWNP
ncbi:hypothetical protein OJF2_32160 [Aquisphaera giovannonii]|uniref:Uncharacterized protein n=1 Tax=Aquisphaera giovannonii TaxID=406548 RepID=A0A5B9W3L9_9BACT|nr:hypothetical protein [Aquisphaera giovannonii]QEH34675.1 hypothetical protein OJF2_32160 [Aquisphaera giovannonii]